jgi:hypothetical protein
MGYLFDSMDPGIRSSSTNQLHWMVCHISNCIFQMLLDRRRMILPLPTTVSGASKLDTYCIFNQYNPLEKL